MHDEKGLRKKIVSVLISSYSNQQNFIQKFSAPNFLTHWGDKSNKAYYCSIYHLKESKIFFLVLKIFGWNFVYLNMMTLTRSLFFFLVPSHRALIINIFSVISLSIEKIFQEKTFPKGYLDQVNKLNSERREFWVILVHVGRLFLWVFFSNGYLDYIAFSNIFAQKDPNEHNFCH